VIPDVLHVANVSSACIADLRDQGEFGIFHIGSGSGTSLNDLVQLLSELFCTELV
jgi:nucleoside-diphosphate-sugar epimerase